MGAALERGRPAGPEELSRRADWIRLETIRQIDRAGLGHYSSTFSCAEILAVNVELLEGDLALFGQVEVSRQCIVGQGSLTRRAATFAVAMIINDEHVQTHVVEEVNLVKAVADVTAFTVKEQQRRWR